MEKVNWKSKAAGITCFVYLLAVIAAGATVGFGLMDFVLMASFIYSMNKVFNQKKNLSRQDWIGLWILWLFPIVLFGILYSI